MLYIPASEPNSSCHPNYYTLVLIGSQLRSDETPSTHHVEQRSVTIQDVAIDLVSRSRGGIINAMQRSPSDLAWWTRWRN